LTIESLDFPSIFTSEQIQFIMGCVLERAQAIFGDSLKDVILYGSYARGDYKEWSDVDIMILADGDEKTCRTLQKAIRSALVELDYHMNGLLSIKVTPNQRFEYFGMEYPFYANVIKEGVRYYRSSAD